MKSIRLLLMIGLIIYLASFFLPAYSITYNFYGYECAYIAFGITIGGDIDGGFFLQLITRAHFLLLGLHNLILPICILLSGNIISGTYRWLLYLLAGSVLNTFLFFFYNRFSAELSGEVLRAGYYVWVLSSLIILIPLAWFAYKNSFIHHSRE